MSQLDILPCRDTDDMATAREKELHLSHDRAIYESRITLAAVENGFSTNSANQSVDWRRAVVDACVAKRSIPPWLSLPAAGAPQFARTRVQVVNETTWGCGAFGNDSDQTASDFRKALEGDFSGALSDVIFAVADGSPQRKYLGPFRDVFA
jgi:uncharacterized protein (TIGR02452 family)